NWGFLAGSTLSGCIMDGYNSAFGDNETSYYIGATLNTPVAGWKVGLAFDDLDVATPHGENWAVGAYSSYQATEKLSFHGRAAYPKNRGEQKVFQGIDTSGNPFPTSPDEVLALTGTVQYDLWKNVLSRLEL